MKLIYESDSKISYEIEESLNEATGRSEKKYKIKGVFSTIGERNRNGRIYPRPLWEREVSRYKGEIEAGSINSLMEWEHPARTSVDPMQAIARIEKVYIQDKYVIGEAVLLNNEKANQIKSLIDAGVKISVSSRGVGTVKNGIVEDFRLTCWDCVAEPSDYNATMNGLVESYRLNEGILEDKEFQINENGCVEEIPICTNDACHMFEKKDIQNAIIEKFSGFIKELSSKTLNEGR